MKSRTTAAAVWTTAADFSNKEHFVFVAGTRRIVRLERDQLAGNAYRCQWGELGAAGRSRTGRSRCGFAQVQERPG